MNQEFIEQLKKYVKAVQDNSDTDAAENHPKLIEINQQNKYGYEMGTRWAKVIITEPQRSVFCFVDPENGDIYKAEGWKKPAKGVRGNINDEKPPLTLGAMYRYR